MNTTLRIKDSHPLLVLSDGTPCGDGSNLNAATVIRFICDNNVFGAGMCSLMVLLFIYSFVTGQPQLVAQLPLDDASSCAFFFEWRTHVACPTARPSGAGSVIAILAALYVLLL